MDRGRPAAVATYRPSQACRQPATAARLQPPTVPQTQQSFGSVVTLRECTSGSEAGTRVRSISADPLNRSVRSVSVDQLSRSTCQLPAHVLAGLPRPPMLPIGLLGATNPSTSGTLLGTATKSLRPPRGLGEYVDIASRTGSRASAAPEPHKRGPLRFISASASRQHPIKREAGYVYADAVTRAPRLLGVCDGVSGVQQLGIKPDELPRELLQECSKAMDHCIAADEVPCDGDGHWLMSLLEEAYDRTAALGATTVLLAAMEDCHRLVVANVGDCGLLVLRPDPSCPSRLSREFRTDELRYEANRPVQVMRLPNTTAAESHLVIQGARMNTVNCFHGDLVVLGSDGIFDNLTDEEIASIVERHCGAFDLSLDSACSPDMPAICSVARLDSSTPRSEPDGSPDQPVPMVQRLQEAAAALVDAAIRNVRPDAAEPDGHEPPQAVEAVRSEKPGGNADDTTAIVAVVLEASNLEQADCGVPIQVPRESFRVGGRRKPTGDAASEAGAGGLLGFAGILPHCWNPSVDRGDDFEESLLCNPKNSCHCRPRKDCESDQPGEPQCSVS
mmetsp:Transcript_79603/g.251580  ORF Transcript_79603/g.251580 Transcript_79603/m.251580 type:complete len:561 (-) Transcript_79603:163-1845(-)